MAALIIGLILDKWFRSESRSTGRTYAVLALAMIAGLAACYLLGTLPVHREHRNRSMGVADSLRVPFPYRAML